MSISITDRAAQVLQQIDAALVNPLPLTKYGRDARKGWRCLKTAIGSLKAIYIASSNEADSEFALKALAAILDAWSATK